jgi:hypothetical protein
MATQLQLRRGNTAQTAVFTGALAEVTVDTDKKTVIVHDGVTAGGYALALEQGSSAQAQAAYNRANSAFGQANLAFDAANSAVTTGQANVGAGLISVTNAYQANVGAARIADIASAQANTGAALIDAKSYTDTSNTNLKNYTDSTFLKLSSPTQTVTGNLILNGYVTVQNDLTISGNVTTINTIELNVADNEVVLNSDWDLSQIPTQNAGITINRGLYTNAFIRYDESNGYWVLRDNVDQYIIATTANVGSGLISAKSAYEANVGSAIAQGQANVGAGLISVTSAYEANIGAARIADVASGQANVGAGLISVTNAYQANVGQLRIDADTANTSLASNIGAARIADTASAQANVGAGLISVTNAYQANVGQLRIDADTANTSLASNIGAARIADVASGQANVGAGLISVTSAYEANVGAGLISVTNAYQANVGQLRIDTDTANSALAANIGAARIADTASAQANVGEAKIISLGRADSAFGQANLAFDKANSANNLAQNAYDAANTATTSGGARAFDQANLAFDKANSAWDYANSAYATANNEILTRQANVGAAVILITGAYGANVGAARIADQATSQANVGAAVISITSAYEANVGAAKIISLSRADSAFAQANLAFDAANNVAPQIQPTRDVANSAFYQANLAFDRANSGFGQANLAYNRANSAWDHANNAFNQANSKISSSGGTIFGDLSITGNLTITGNTTTINVASLAITDTIIQLGIENLNDTFDIGFVGHYANTPNNHTGLVRRAADGKYYLFDNFLTDEPGNIIDFANTRVATLSANLVTNVITLRGVDPLDYANTIQTASQANVGAGLITVTNAYQANVGAARIADTASAQANVGTGLIALNTSVTNAYRANVGAGLISTKAAYEANVGAGLITKVSKAGDTMTGVLTLTGGDGTYSSLELNGNNGRGGPGYHGFLTANNTSATNGGKHFRINSAGGLEIVNSAYTALIFALSNSGDLTSINTIALPNSYQETGSITTSTTAQTTLDSFLSTTYRSAKYLVQMTSGSAYHMIELSFIHDGTTVYMSQYGEVKSGASLGTFAASISAGTLSLFFTPTNAVTTAKYVGTLIPV